MFLTQNGTFVQNVAVCDEKQPKGKQTKRAAYVRKSVVSIKFPPVILGPEMAAPILWAPGIFWFFLLGKNPHAHKIPPFRGGSGFF